jgi:hemoglobin
MTQTSEIATRSLYDRVGGGAALRRIVSDTVDAHLANPAVSARFRKYDPTVLKDRAFPFFAQATGGPEQYTGAGLGAVHEGMNISPEEFVAVTDDLLGVLRRHGVGDREQQEILAAFFAWKDELLHT